MLFCAGSVVATTPIVKDGKTDWVIVVPKGASATEEFAGQELGRYLEKMSGAQFKIAGQSGDGKQIVVATFDHAMKNGAVPDNLVKPEGEDGYSIVEGSDLIVICGTTPRGTLHGVYVFLDSLGYRFLAPGFDHYKGTNEVVPKRGTVEADASRLTDPSSPVMKFRKLYVEEGHSHTIENLKELVEWMPKVGYNTLVVPTDYQGHGKVKWDNWRKELTPELMKRGITIEVGGHGYQNFLNGSMEGGKLFQEHPEWFGEDAKGVRRADEQEVFCTSNPAAVKYLIDRFVAYVKDRPEIQIYDFWPPDGARWCECEECKKLGTPSDRQAILLGQVKEAVAKVRPDLRLEMIAYSSYTMPPEHVAVDPSVLVDFCPISQQFDHAIDDSGSKLNAGYANALKAWREKFSGDISIYSYYRKYAWDSLPLVLPHYMQHDLQWYARLPVQGVSVYSEPGDWFTYELNHYVLAALAWDPKVDVDEVIRKFAAARYGTAAEVGVKAYAALEDVVRSDCSVPNKPRKGRAELQKGEARLVAVQEEVKKAAAEMEDQAVKYNLGRLSLMLDYAIGDIRTQELVWKKDVEGAKKEAAGVFDEISAHGNDGVFLSREGRLSKERLMNRMGVEGKGLGAE
jgi:hypothetical protein